MNANPIPERRPIPRNLSNYSDELNAEVDSPLNTWGAGEVAGHTPDHDERLTHYLLHANRREMPRPKISGRTAINPSPGEPSAGI